MIQRIQSVWLMLATVSIFLTMNFATYAGAHQNEVMHLIKGTENTLLVLMTSAVGVTCMIALILFKNRKLQLRIALIALFLEFVLAALYFKEILAMPVKGTFGVASLLHVAVVVFILLALKGISGDERMVKESNRLR
jgi:peptidoglycan/LPS O-acetylase OafA/YrhL